MKNVKLFLLSFLFLSVFLNSCEQKTDVVDSGTYQGDIDKVEVEKTEIYVKTADGKRLELYFTPTTTLTKNDQEVPFEVLKEGDKVEVEVKKVGKRLDPVAVKVLE